MTVARIPRDDDSGRKGGESRSTGTSSRFGQLLRQARNDREITLQELSSKSDVSITYLSDLERGKLTNPTLEIVRRVAAALGVSLNDLLELNEGISAPAYPAALQDLSKLPQFQQALIEQSVRFRVPESDLEGEWLRVLARIRIQNRRPRTPLDYYFLFDAIARTL